MRAPTSAIALAAFAAVLTLGAARPAAAQLNFNLTDGAGLSSLQSSNPTLYSQVRGGFVSAANLWSAVLSDPITVNITIDYFALTSGALGEASPTLLTSSYQTIREFLSDDRTSALDTTAVANLPPSNPTYVTNPGVTIAAGSLNGTKANFKALGFTGLDAAFGAEDAAISFNSGFAFDFDRSDGIASNQYDFVGVAAHEIGHALGFISSVDIIGTASSGTFEPFVLDLYRFSASSAASGARDVSTNNFDKYFSVDGGFSDVNGGAIDILFSNGVSTTDGRQASHWRDNAGIGIMDPTAAPGELLTITGIDQAAFDVIGWNLNAVAVPEPASAPYLVAGLSLFGALHVARRRRR